MYTYTISFVSPNGTSVEHLSYYMKATPYIFACGDLGAHRDFLPSPVFQSNPLFTCLFLNLLQIYRSVLDPATSMLLCLQLLSHLPHIYIILQSLLRHLPQIYIILQNLLSHLPQIHIILQNLLSHLPHLTLLSPDLHYSAEPVKPLAPDLHYFALAPYFAAHLPQIHITLAPDLHYFAEPVKPLTPDSHYSAEPVKPLTPGLHYSAEQTGFHSQPLAAQQPVTALSPQWNTESTEKYNKTGWKKQKQFPFLASMKSVRTILFHSNIKQWRLMQLGFFFFFFCGVSSHLMVSCLKAI